MAEWIRSVIDSLGPFGVGVLIALETIIPPIPSELVLPLAGFRAREGAMNVVLVWFAATIGGVAAALLLYWLGAWLGYERLHRLAGHRWFVPVLRSLVSLPAGMTGMPVPRFLALTALGTGLWNAAFIAAGWFLAEKWQKVDAYTGPVSLVVVGLIVVGLVVLAWRRSHEKATVRS